MNGEKEKVIKIQIWKIVCRISVIYSQLLTSLPCLLLLAGLTVQIWAVAAGGGACHHNIYTKHNIVGRAEPGMEAANERVEWTDKSMLSAAVAGCHS